jgi:hypothetical protein
MNEEFNYIDRDEISQEVLNIDNKTRSSLYTWNGQFSPQFIEALLDKYATASDIVFDPFMGSGTTLIECARKNIEATGIEINPSAYFMSKSFELCNINNNDRAIMINKIQGILDTISYNRDIIEILKQNANLADDNKVKNIISLLIVLMDINNNEISTLLLMNKWEQLKTTLLNLPYTTSPIKALNGDTRQTKLSDDLFSLIITSPPYINVFNYHQKYRHSVEVLGYDVLKIARGEFGSNRKHRGNRLYTVVQYCIDMALAMREWMRISKEQARFILIVGRESNILSMNFSNSQLVYEVASQVLKMTFLLRQERVFKNRYGKMIYEDILHFKNNKYGLKIDESKVIEAARKVAVNSLKQKLLVTNSDFKNYYLVDDAIKNAEKIKKSEEIDNG